MNVSAMGLEHMINRISGFLSSPMNNVQLVLLLASIGVGGLIAPLLTQRLGTRILPTSRWYRLYKAIQSVVAFGCIAALVLMSMVSLDLLGYPVNVLIFGFQLLAFVVLFIALRRLTHSQLLSGLMVGAALVPWAYHQVGEMSLLHDQINRFSIQIGSVNLTPVTLIKGLILLGILGWGSSLIVHSMNAQIKRNRKIRANTKALLSKVVEVIIYFVAFVLGLRVMGIDLTAFAVLGGALGVGIGFGLQKITSNFISGIILLVERSIEVNDLIEMDGGIYGFVRQINARFILIETFDGKEVMVPNEDFVTQRVTNWTYSNSTGRVEVPIGVSYGSDIRLVQQLIIDAARAHEKCISDPEPVCHLREFGDSSVNFLLYFFVADVSAGRFQIQSEVMFSIWDKFKEHNIEIPFPQRDLHIKSGVNVGK
ncbi:MAG: mechanosensitive ion channel [bacterium]|nr:mechanosensitive ion channel [bacterium]